MVIVYSVYIKLQMRNRTVLISFAINMPMEMVSMLIISNVCHHPALPMFLRKLAGNLRGGSQ